jgi:hypothetical protein
MSKHTPGPWYVFNTADIFTNLGAKNAEGIEASSRDGWMIADCDMGGLCLAEVRANSSLIAAAPELLEALEAILPFIPNSSAAEGGAARFSANVAAADKVRAAIAKARGES